MLFDNSDDKYLISFFFSLRKIINTCNSLHLKSVFLSCHHLLPVTLLCSRVPDGLSESRSNEAAAIDDLHELNLGTVFTPSCSAQPRFWAIRFHTSPCESSLFPQPKAASINYLTTGACVADRSRSSCNPSFPPLPLSSEKKSGSSWSRTWRTRLPWRSLQLQRRPPPPPVWQSRRSRRSATSPECQVITRKN